MSSPWCHIIHENREHECFWPQPDFSRLQERMSRTNSFSIYMTSTKLFGTHLYSKVKFFSANEANRATTIFRYQMGLGFTGNLIFPSKLVALTAWQRFQDLRMNFQDFQKKKTGSVPKFQVPWMCVNPFNFCQVRNTSPTSVAQNCVLLSSMCTSLSCVQNMSDLCFHLCERPQQTSVRTCPTEDRRMSSLWGHIMGRHPIHGRIQDFCQGGQAEFWPCRVLALSPKFAQNRGFSLKIASKLWFFSFLGGKGAQAPRVPWIHWCHPLEATGRDVLCQKKKKVLVDFQQTKTETGFMPNTSTTILWLWGDVPW